MYESRREILNQADALLKTAEAVLSHRERIARFFERQGDIVFVACGSSYWASLSAMRTLQMAHHRSTHAVKAGDVMMNPAEYADCFEAPLLIVPSRSGTTTEQLEAVRILREAYGEAPVLSLIVSDDSPLEDASDLVIRIPWCNEISVCQTRSFSCLYLGMVMLAALYDEELLHGMRRYLGVSEALAERDFPRVEALVKAREGRDRVVAIGSGRQYGVTIEGAYICVEMAQIPANYYTVTELRHGPIVTVDDQTTLFVCSMRGARPIEEQMAREAKAQGAHVVAVTAEERFEGADTLFSLGGDYPPEAVALHFVFVMQAYAHALAVQKGLNPDQPGDLVRAIHLAI